MPGGAILYNPADVLSSGSPTGVLVFDCPFPKGPYGGIARLGLLVLSPMPMVAGGTLYGGGGPLPLDFPLGVAVVHTF